MMELYFLRHGVAVSGEEWSGDDEERPLTQKGIERMELEARQLAGIGFRPERILTSPLARARQTAEIVARELGLIDRLREERRLAPGFRLGTLRELLEENASAASLLLVGHEPDFSETVGSLIGGGRVECKKGGLARVDLLDPRSMAAASLAWLLPPQLLAR